MVSNGECSQLGSHGSYMNACMRPETPAIGPMVGVGGGGVPSASWLRSVRGRYPHGDRGTDRTGGKEEIEREWRLNVVVRRDGPLP